MKKVIVLLNNVLTGGLVAVANNVLTGGLVAVLLGALIGCTTTKTKDSQPGVVVNSPAPIEMVEPRQILHKTRAVVIFNGFPSYYTHNADFAYVLAARMKLRTFIIDYKGLKQQPGRFSFIGAITDAKLAVGELQRKFNLKEVFVIGHSWGGVVALNVMREYPQLVRKAFLLAPLLIIRDQNEMTPILQKTFLVQNELRTMPVDIGQLGQEIPVLKASYMPISFAKDLRGKIAIAHNKADKVVPFASSQKFAELLGNNVTIIESGQDHWLAEDRPGLLRKAQAFFQE